MGARLVFSHTTNMRLLFDMIILYIMMYSYSSMVSQHKSEGRVQPLYVNAHLLERCPILTLISNKLISR